ncbi:MAG: 50S ribosomal protein L17 [Candidatus Caenarcaniphilales bacterium]|nr:50S ribosomal protein L17 [Candidatus Caenarcaniphilales bacterium]
MRHSCKRNSLSLPADQRDALMKSLARALLVNGRIKTTNTRAKLLRSFIEKLLTKAKKSLAADESSKKLHYIRLIRRVLAGDLIQPLFKFAGALSDRSSGYTRIVKLTTQRQGDNSPMALIEILEA